MFHLKKSENFFSFLSFVLIIMLFVINVITVKNGHNWGDDFSQYIIHAKNILEGKHYNDRIMLKMPIIYPPGYPLLIAPFIKYGGVNFVLLKLINVFLWYLSLLFIYPVFLRMQSSIQ